MSRDCACGQHERGARLYDKRGMPTESHWGDYCDLANGTRFLKGDTLLGAERPPAADAGLRLAASLLADELAKVADVLRRVRQKLDHDDEDADLGSFVVEHDRMCPADALNRVDGIIRDPRSPAFACACGLESALDRLRDAEARIEAAIAQAKRIGGQS